MSVESKLQENIVDHAIKCGMVAYKLEAKGKKGFPDLFLAKDGHIELWEVKSPKKTGRYQPSQKKRIPELLRAGVCVRRIDNYDAAKHIIAHWGQEAPPLSGAPRTKLTLADFGQTD